MVSDSTSNPEKIDRALAQASLGNALKTLGEREKGTTGHPRRATLRRR